MIILLSYILLKNLRCKFEQLKTSKVISEIKMFTPDPSTVSQLN